MAKYGDRVKDPFQYLKDDHDKTSELFKKLLKTREKAKATRTKLFKQINDELLLHVKLEDKVVYPILEKMKLTHDLALEGEQEHHVIKLLLKELSKENCATEEWGAKAKVLEENVEHHVKEEERLTGLFNRARLELTSEQIETLRKKMEKFLAK